MSIAVCGPEAGSVQEYHLHVAVLVVYQEVAGQQSEGVQVGHLAPQLGMDEARAAR